MERKDAVETLSRTGLVDDRRYAERRAEVLARRGAGDVVILHELELAGVERELADDAVRLLDSETERARRVVARRGMGARTARYLARKGFSEEAIAASATIRDDVGELDPPPEGDC